MVAEGHGFQCESREEDGAAALADRVFELALCLVDVSRNVALTRLDARWRLSSDKVHQFDSITFVVEKKVKAIGRLSFIK